MAGDHLPSSGAADPFAADSAVVGTSPAMKRLHRLIERVAATDATVLITGESGTGKEMIAGEFFRRSRRRDQPYVKVNCAAISPTLIESEFFGHEKGAYTGATERREGRFELAQNGSLLLDEVSEIPPALQAKLLRVLQEREFERVGGSKTIKVNVRVIATSNRHLLSHVASGHFRQDLYYRLNVFPIQIPPLRERVEDIPLLAEHFLTRFSGRHGVSPAGFSADARRALLEYRWPGNVRELQNSVERAVILCEDGRPITADILGLAGEVHLPVVGDTGALHALDLRGRSAAIAPARQPDTAADSAVLGDRAGSVPPNSAVAVIRDLCGFAGLDPAAAAVADRDPVEPVAAAAAAAEPVDWPDPRSPDPAAAAARAETAPTGAIEPFTATHASGRPLTLGEVEKRVIRQALERHRGNRTHAAVTLGISLRTLRNKLAEYRATGDSLDAVGLESHGTAA